MSTSFSFTWKVRSVCENTVLQELVRPQTAEASDPQELVVASWMLAWPDVWERPRDRSAVFRMGETTTRMDSLNGDNQDLIGKPMVSWRVPPKPIDYHNPERENIS